MISSGINEGYEVVVACPGAYRSNDDNRPEKRFLKEVSAFNTQFFLIGEDPRKGTAGPNFA